jgi:hypothetical protein
MIIWHEFLKGLIAALDQTRDNNIYLHKHLTFASSYSTLLLYKIKLLRLAPTQNKTTLFISSTLQIRVFRRD